MLVPEHLRRALQRLSSNMTVCPPAISQYAAVAAFTDESRAELDGHVQRYAANGNCCSQGCRSSVSPSSRPPTARSTCTPTSPTSPTNSTSWCARLLADTGLALAPGIDFDTAHGDHTVRMSFAGATAEIRDALVRLERWLPAPR